MKLRNDKLQVNNQPKGTAKMAKLIINQETLERLRGEQSWGMFAEDIGVDQGTLSRIRRGKSLPGNGFIAKVITTYPVRMDELVTVVAA